MRRLLRLFLVAVLAAFCVSANVSAAGGIELVSLEPTFTSDAIEINKTPSGYNFSVTLLDSNLELNYDAVIKNNENSNITIESIDFTNSSYDFLEYSYEGISIGDTIGKEELRNIKLTIRTNAAEKQAVSEVFNLSFTYSYDDSGTNPSTGDVIVGAVYLDSQEFAPRPIFRYITGVNTVCSSYGIWCSRGHEHLHNQRPSQLFAHL